LPHDRALACAHGDVAQHVACHVAEQAVEHVRAGELCGLAVQREDVGHHLALQLPDQVEVGQDRHEPQRARRQGERAGQAGQDQRSAPAAAQPAEWPAHPTGD